MSRKENTRIAYGIGKRYLDGPDVLSIERLARELGMKDYEVLRILLESGEYQDVTRELSPDQYAEYRLYSDGIPLTVVSIWRGVRG